MLLRRKLWTYIFYLVKKYFSLKNTEQMSEKTNQKEVCGQKKTAQQNKCGQAKVLSICRKSIRRIGQKNFAFSRKALDKMCGLWYNLSCCRKAIWVWRSLVARYLGVVEAVGSSPATRTTSSRTAYRSRRRFFISKQTPSLIHSVAPPFPTKPAALRGPQI